MASKFEQKLTEAESVYFPKPGKTTQGRKTLTMMETSIYEPDAEKPSMARKTQQGLDKIVGGLAKAASWGGESEAMPAVNVGTAGGVQAAGASQRQAEYKNKYGQQDQQTTMSGPPGGNQPTQQLGDPKDMWNTSPELKKLFPNVTDYEDYFNKQTQIELLKQQGLLK